MSYGQVDTPVRDTSALRFEASHSDVLFLTLDIAYLALSNPRHVLRPSRTRVRNTSALRFEASQSTVKCDSPSSGYLILTLAMSYARVDRWFGIQVHFNSKQVQLSTECDSPPNLTFLTLGIAYLSLPNPRHVLSRSGTQVQRLSTPPVPGTLGFSTQVQPCTQSPPPLEISDSQPLITPPLISRQIHTPSRAEFDPGLLLASKFNRKPVVGLAVHSARDSSYLLNPRHV